MEHTQREYEAPPRRWPQRAMWGAAGLALLLALFTVAVYFRYGSERSRRLAAIRAAGEPLTIEELMAARPALSTDQDATNLWIMAMRSAAAAVKPQEAQSLPFIGEGASPPPPGREWPQLAAAQKFLDAQAQTLAEIHAATDRGGQARFARLIIPGPPQTPWAMTIDNDLLGELRTCSRLLRLEVVVRAHAGDIHGAAESLRAMLLLPRALEDEPLAVLQMYRAGVFSGAIAQLQELLPTAAWQDDDLLLLLGDTLQQFDFHSHARQLLLGERAFGLAMFQTMQSGAAWQRVLARGLYGRDEIEFLDIMAAHISAAELPWIELRATVAARDAELASRPRWSGAITRLSLSSLNSELDSLARAEVKRRLAIVAIALERYRRRTGEPPATLTKLVPDYLPSLPVDLASGEQFRYRVGSSGYELSAGSLPNREENIFRWSPEGSAPVSETGKEDE